MTAIRRTRDVRLLVTSVAHRVELTRSKLLSGTVGPGATVAFRLRPQSGASLTFVMAIDRTAPALAVRDVARKLYGSVKGLPIVSPHGHTNPQWFAEFRKRTPETMPPIGLYLIRRAETRRQPRAPSSIEVTACSIPHPKAPGLSLAGVRLVISDHAMGLPVLRALSLCTCCRQYPGAATGRRLRSSRPAVSAFPEIAVGSACTSTFSRLARRSLALRPAHSRRHLYVTRYTEGFSHFVTSMTAPVASGWSVRRVGLSPTGKRRLLTAHGEAAILQGDKGLSVLRSSPIHRVARSIERWGRGSIRKGWTIGLREPQRGSLIPPIEGQTRVGHQLVGSEPRRLLPCIS